MKQGETDGVERRRTGGAGEAAGAEAIHDTRVERGGE